MTTAAQPKAPTRSRTPRPPTPPESGLPDPRPVTDYSVSLTIVGPHSRLTVTLMQPCAIRSPRWALINCIDGSRLYPASVTVVNNTTFYFEYGGILESYYSFVEVPYQDTQVQNSQGGYVAPGAKWFRDPSPP
jgi:hypothetical protein